MQITTQWPIGQFLTSITATVNDERISDALVVALKHEGQRFSGIDKILGGFEKGADGKEKRKADYKRGAVDYTEDLALALSEALAAFLLAPDKDEEGKDVPSLFSAVSVPLPTKYEGGAAEPKFAAEKRAVTEYLSGNGGKLASGEARTIETFVTAKRAAMGLASPADPEKWTEDAEFLASVKAYLKAVNSQE